MAATKLTRLRERGMTLIEVMVALVLLTLILIAFLGILDTSARVAKTQGHIADSTENLRFSVAALVRLLRMAGAGGVPLVYPTVAEDPTNPAADRGLTALGLLVWDNADPSNPTSYGGKTRVPGTDVVRIRGVMIRDVWEVQPAVAGEVTFNSATLVGSATVRYVAPFSERFQMPEEPVPDAPLVLLLRGRMDLQATNSGTTVFRHFSQYRIARVTGASTSDSTHPDAPEDAEDVTISFIGTDGDGDGDGVTTEFVGLNEATVFADVDTTNVISVGVLDELLFFVGFNDAGMPTLYRFGAIAEELVPNIVNMQIALYCDLNMDGIQDAGEWFLTAGNPAMPTGDEMMALREARITLVSRSQQADVEWVESMPVPENSPAMTADERRYRHRTVSVHVGLRSQPPPELS